MEHKFSFKRVLSILVVLTMVFSSVAVFAFNANAEDTDSVILIDAVNAASWADGEAVYGPILVYGTENTIEGYIGGIWNGWWYKIFATYDEAEGGFIVSEKLPNDGDSSYAAETLGEGEILILVYPGAEANLLDTVAAAASVEAGDKLVATGFDFTNESVADIVTKDGDNFASEVYFTVIPAVEETPDTPDVPVDSENVAAGKPYSASEQFRMGGADVGWGWDENAAICYPDEDNKTMTDGILPAENAEYTAAEWAGWNGGTPPVVESTGYNWITIDLGESMDLCKYVVWHGDLGLSNGIGAPEKIEVFVSENGQEWGEEPVATVEPERTQAILVSTTLEGNATGRYVQFRFHCGTWTFLGELEVYNGTVSDDEPVDPPVDDEPEVPEENIEDELKEALGEANADPKFDLVINAPETYKAGDEITVTVTVKNITAEPGVHVLNFNLVYDNEKLVLTNDLDEEDQNMLVCVDTDTDNGYPKGWENFSKVNCTVADGVATADNDGIIFASVLTDKDSDTAAIKTDDVIVFTFTFTAKEDATGDIGLVIPHESAEGAINDASGATIFAGNGTYAIIAEAEDEPEVPSEDPSEDPSESDTPVKPGDASAMIVFAIIALVAVAGSAVVIKSRK